MKEIRHDRPALLPVYFFATTLISIIFCLTTLPKLAVMNPLTIFFSLTMVITYGVAYLIPAMLITAGCHKILSIVFPESTFNSAVTKGVAVLTSTTSLTLLFADHVVFRLFGFHLNGFVWNLVTTPGGIDSMGGSSNSTMTYGMIVLAILGLQILTLTLCFRLNLGVLTSKKVQSWAWVFFIIMATSQALIYGVNSFKNNMAIINIATVLPLYQPLTLKGLAKRLHIPKVSSKQIQLQASDGTLHYPLEPLIAHQQNTPPPNIVWLVAESWRADTLTPKIMPKMTAFASSNIRFKQHYSGGNGTRMGVFSQFYGLYGAYWFQFLNQQRSPVILDVMQQQNYQFGLYTSAQFSYPEFDKTIFSAMDKSVLHDDSTGAGWQRDRTNVDKVLSFIKERDPSRPFMTFMFFESPHARYYFPKEDAVFTPYLKDLNYATMSLTEDMDLIHNRYLNSVHHLDSQLARITDYLEKTNLLENTIVIITGDHGEEFMENGHWGHNSEFTEQQTRVPLVLHIPGTPEQEIERMTSHLDIPATVLPLLGVANNPETYSLGYDLLGEKHRKYTIISDWYRIAYVDQNLKAIIPFFNHGVTRSYFTTRQDSPLTDQNNFWKNRQKTMVKVLHNLSLFFRVKS